MANDKYRVDFEGNADSITAAAGKAKASVEAVSASTMTLGEGVRKAWYSVRMLAYVLPGIGIAGIMGAVAGVIMKLFDLMGGMGSASAAMQDFTAKVYRHQDALISAATAIKIYNRELANIGTEAKSAATELKELNQAVDDNTQSKIKFAQKERELAVAQAGGIQDPRARAEAIYQAEMDFINKKNNLEQQGFQEKMSNEATALATARNNKANADLLFPEWKKTSENLKFQEKTILGSGDKNPGELKKVRDELEKAEKLLIWFEEQNIPAWGQRQTVADLKVRLAMEEQNLSNIQAQQKAAEELANSYEKQGKEAAKFLNEHEKGKDLDKLSKQVTDAESLAEKDRQIALAKLRSDEEKKTGRLHSIPDASSLERIGLVLGGNAVSDYQRETAQNTRRLVELAQRPVKTVTAYGRLYNED